MPINVAYGKFEGYEYLAYNCIRYMLENDDEIWRLLKYNAPDAWAQPALTHTEKAALIYAGQEDETTFRVFMDEGQVNAFLGEIAMVRIFPYAVFPNNRAIATLTIAFDVFSHYRVNHLSNYTTRVDAITARILKVFNGANIGGLGLLYFDAMQAKENRVYPQGQIPYKGKRITMAVNSG